MGFVIAGYRARMQTWMWLTIWAVVIATVAALWVRERMKHRKPIDFDPYASKGQGDDIARMDQQLRGPNSGGMGSF